MSRAKEGVFYLGLGTLLSHELDAVANHEWRLLPLLRSLPEDLAMTVFVTAHIPIFALLLALVGSSNIRIRVLSRLGVGLFLGLHALLHMLFLGHADYEFSSVMSEALIYGGGLLGLTYLTLEARESHAAVD